MAPTPATGLLGSVDRFTRWLDLASVVVVVACAVRYLHRHGVADVGVVVLAGAAVLIALQLVGSRISSRVIAATLAVAAAVVWAGLTFLAPSFAWAGVPFAFGVLRVLAAWPGIAVVVAMSAVVPIAWWRLLEAPDLTVIVGPIVLALITVIAYRTLDGQVTRSRNLADALMQVRDDLAAADRREGALAERTRLSREIHDSVGQGLSSVLLLLNAADQQWTNEPARARRHIATANQVARASLEDVRRVVRDLAPVELAGDDPAEPGQGLVDALTRVLAQAGPALATELRIDGDPVAVSPELGTALVRTAQGALANTIEHSRATRFTATLTRQHDEIRLDLHDNGQGFDADTSPRGVSDSGTDEPLRGLGLAGIAARAGEWGGQSSVDSSADGTIVSVSFPLGPEIGHG